MSAERLLILAGGLAGATGVGLSAAAAHLGGGNVLTAANFMLFHAAALVAIGLGSPSRVMKLGGGALVLGLILFCGDLLIRHYVGWRLLPMAAPAGGLLLIGGWLIVALGALTLRR